MSQIMIILLIALLKIFFIFCSGNNIRHFNLTAGEICLKGNNGLASNSYCQRLDQCPESRWKTTEQIVPLLCSFDGSHPIICCLSHEFESKKSNDTSDHQKEKNSYIASKMCDKYSKIAQRTHNISKFVTYIIGGKNAARIEFPHMAHIGFGDTIENVDWNCGGSLISNSWVLSAAHCVESRIFSDDESVPPGIPRVIKAKWVRLGALYSENSSDYYYRSDYKIVERKKHPSYQEHILYYDIGLFRLDREVQFSDYVMPICLNVDESIVSQKVIATGWGDTSPDGDQSSHLLKVDLDIIPTSYCNNTYSTNKIPELIFGVFDKIQMCAGSYLGGKDTCQGDSGGPLQIKHKIYPGMYAQIAITSVGRSCGDKKSPGVYTKISSSISWIENIVWPN